MSTLKFSTQNRKLNELASYLGLKKTEVVGFDLPAGYTCPAASLCRAYSDKVTGKITRGKDMQFLCYAAKLEAVFPSSRRAHWHNFDLLHPIMKDAVAMAEMIEASLPNKAKVVRIHTSGDFFNKAYFQAWVTVATNHPEIVFFGYTKVLPLLSESLPSNMHLAYSMGGKFDQDYLNNPVVAPSCTVVSSKDEADKNGLNIACPTSTSPNDYNYIVRGESFAILVH